MAVCAENIALRNLLLQAPNAPPQVYGLTNAALLLGWITVMKIQASRVRLTALEAAKPSLHLIDPGERSFSPDALRLHNIHLMSSRVFGIPGLAILRAALLAPGLPPALRLVLPGKVLVALGLSAPRTHLHVLKSTRISRAGRDADNPSRTEGSTDAVLARTRRPPSLRLAAILRGTGWHGKHPGMLPTSRAPTGIEPATDCLQGSSSTWLRYRGIARAGGAIPGTWLSRRSALSYSGGTRTRILRLLIGSALPSGRHAS